MKQITKDVGCVNHSDSGAQEEDENLEEEGSSSSLIASNNYFKKLIDLVPPKAYFDVETKELLNSHSVSHERLQHEEVVTTSTSSQVKREDGDRSTTKRKSDDKHIAKKANLNPMQATKTSELQQILPKLKDSIKKLQQQSNFVDSQNNCDSNEPMNTLKSVDSNDDGLLLAQKVDDSKVVKRSKAKKAKNKLSNNDSVLTHSMDTETSNSSNAVSVVACEVSSSNGTELSSSSGDISKRSSPATVTLKPNPQELREKLRARISELQVKRHKGMTPEEFFESKKLRRKESKLKLKQKRKEAKKLKLSIEKQAKNSQKKLNGVSEVKSESDGKSSGNNNIVFSKFQFSEQAKKPKDRKSKKPKSYTELYEKVTKDKAKLDELKETDPEKAKRIAEKTAWRKAMEQSKGVKVKDNPDLIKKSMKKEQKLKQRSQKKWEERTAAVANQQQKRQEKRTKNILAKKQSKADRKMKLAKKKGRLVSGF